MFGLLLVLVMFILSMMTVSLFFFATLDLLLLIRVLYLSIFCVIDLLAGILALSLSKQCSGIQYPLLTIFCLELCWLYELQSLLFCLSATYWGPGWCIFIDCCPVACSCACNWETIWVSICKWFFIVTQSALFPLLLGFGYKPEGFVFSTGWIMFSIAILFLSSGENSHQM